MISDAELIHLARNSALGPEYSPRLRIIIDACLAHCESTWNDAIARGRGVSASWAFQAICAMVSKHTNLSWLEIGAMTKHPHNSAREAAIKYWRWPDAFRIALEVKLENML